MEKNLVSTNLRRFYPSSIAQPKLLLDVLNNIGLNFQTAGWTFHALNII